MNGFAMRGMRPRRLALAAALAAAGLGGGLNQPDARGQDMMAMMRGGSKMQLLAMREVQRELKLTGAQNKQITNAMKEFQKKLQNQVGSGRSGDAQSLVNVMSLPDELDKAVTAPLTPDQLRRLRELNLQFLGPVAILDPGVVGDMKLADEQKTRIAAIRDKADAETQRDMLDMGKIRSEGKARAMQKRMQDRKKATAEQILAALTPEQTARWQTMLGSPFKFPKNSNPF